MDYYKNQLIIIEANLKCDLSIKEVASEAGFSVYHFSRIFNDYVGMPVLAYITKRRLLHIIYNTQSSNKLVDGCRGDRNLGISIRGKF